MAALGGKWDKAGKCWMVPEDKAEEARKLVSTPASAMAKASGQAFYCRAGEGWAVCCPQMAKAGDVVDVRTKAGKVKREVLGAFMAKRADGYVFATNGRVYQTGRAMADVRGPRDPGEDAADRWNEGGGVA